MSGDIYHIVEGRRSIRRYQPGGIDRSLVLKVLEAATRAPSAHNRQPWRWLVLESGPAKDALARGMGQALAERRRLDGDDPAVIEADVERSIKRISDAPVVIVASLTMEEMDRYPDAERQQAEFLMAVQSVAMAGQNLMLVAHAEGLGTCWMCAPLFSKEAVAQAIDLPENWVPQGLILLGYPETGGKQSLRKPMDEVLRWI